MRRRLAPHQLRHAHAVEMAREGVPLIVIQRQLGHTNSASPRSTSRASTHRDHRGGPLTSRTDGPRRQLAPALTAATGGGEAALARRRSSFRSPARNRVASGSQSAPFIANERCTRCKRPTPFSRSSTHAPMWLSCASRRCRKHRAGTTRQRKQPFGRSMACALAPSSRATVASGRGVSQESRLQPVAGTADCRRATAPGQGASAATRQQGVAPDLGWAAVTKSTSITRTDTLAEIRTIDGWSSIRCSEAEPSRPETAWALRCS